MAKMIQIRHVPETVHRTLKARAAAEGKSLSDYLREEIEQIAECPSIEEMKQRLARRARLTLPVSPTQMLREERDRM
jgi:antitoxin FitA